MDKAIHQESCGAYQGSLCEFQMTILLLYFDLNLNGTGGMTNPHERWVAGLNL